LEHQDIILIATNDKEANKAIRNMAKKERLLVNVADTPDLCDFYLSSVVQKDSLKIAISTNGKSPTLAKRVKELLNDVLPNDIEMLLNNLQTIRNQLKGDFEEKVKYLNDLTKKMVEK
jgi:siroheme synthase-like protein